MNYIPVDISCVEELFNSGRQLYNRIHPVKDLTEAKSLAAKGKLFMKSCVTEEEIIEVLKLQKQIKEKQKYIDSVVAKIQQDAEIALANKLFNSFEFESTLGSIQISNKCKVIPYESDSYEILYKLLGDKCVEKQTIYTLNKDLSSAIKILAQGIIKDTTIEDAIKQMSEREGILDDWDVVLKKIGKTYNTRVNKLNSVYKLDKQSASDWAYVLQLIENYKKFQKIHEQSVDKCSEDKFISILTRHTNVSNNIAVTIKPE